MLNGPGSPRRVFATSPDARHTLVGMVHLGRLFGEGRVQGPDLATVEAEAARDAERLAAAGFDAIFIENFGDRPFYPDEVPPWTIAALTRCVLAVQRAVGPALPLGVNVLRNDARAALSVAAATGAHAIRVNVHVGAAVTDQGIIQGDAAATMRLRRALRADNVSIWADVDVKHSAPLGGPRPLEQEVEDLTKRGMADVVLVTGDGTGKGVDLDKLMSVKKVASKPVLVASGATIDTLHELARASDGVVVGSALREGGVPGGPVDAGRAREFAAAFKTAFGSSVRPRSEAQPAAAGSQSPPRT